VCREGHRAYTLPGSLDITAQLSSPRSPPSHGQTLAQRLLVRCAGLRIHAVRTLRGGAVVRAGLGKRALGLLGTQPLHPLGAARAQAGERSSEKRTRVCASSEGRGARVRAFNGGAQCSIVRSRS